MMGNLDKIDHIVVLMMENRSFDYMVGWLYDPENDPPFDRVPAGQSYNGLSGKDLSNPIPSYADEATRKVVRVGKGDGMSNPNPDPGEDYPHVNTQLFGEVNPPKNRYGPFGRFPYNLPGARSGWLGRLEAWMASITGGPFPKSLPDPAPMDGFVRDYINNYRDLAGEDPNYDQFKVIMDCFTPDKVPVLSLLAHSYAICDQWHCSVPSQTYPNRSFVHAATSHGFVLNSPYVNWLLAHAPTIFNRIEDDPRSEVSWKVYYDKEDLVSGTYLLQPSIRQYRKTRFRYMNDFYTDAAQGTLPSYSFIEPRLLIDHNDMHPPIADPLVTSSVLAGELLIRDIYQAVREGANWERTLLIITFDEHGGCYDHVSPPPAVPPNSRGTPGQMGFRFDRLGLRVPTVLISPFIEEGTVDNTLYDHTSIIKTVANRWNLPPLTERDKAAADVSGVFNRSTPRDDYPILMPRPYEPATGHEGQKLNDYQKALLSLVAGFEAMQRIKNDRSPEQKVEDIVRLIEEEGEILKLQTVADGINFIEQRLHVLG